MADYCVNNQAQSNGDHEVHVYTCSYLPADFTYLGSFDSCYPAVVRAKQYYPQSNGCYWCCRACHTG